MIIQDMLRAAAYAGLKSWSTNYNLFMRLSTAIILLFVPVFVFAVFACGAFAQNSAKSGAEPKSVTVPVTLDHNRIVIDVFVPLSDGSTKRVRGWVDTGDADLWVSPRVGQWMGLTTICNGGTCTAAPPADKPLQIVIGGMNVSLAPATRIKVPGLRPPDSDDVMVPGIGAEIKIPSTVLRNYDVLINYPDREFGIGVPGSIPFKGVKSKMLVSAGTGFIQIPSKIANKSYNIGLDTGSSISFLSQELFEKLATAHPDWPHMTGAVGPANLGESFDDESKWRLLRIDRLQFGPLYLTDLAVAEFPRVPGEFFEKEAGSGAPGLIGANALMNYRVGLDYAHSTAYFDLGSTFKFPEFDVVGLVLRPGPDARFTIVGVADFEGKPSVPEVVPGELLIAVDGIPVPDSTMGQVCRCSRVRRDRSGS